MASALDAIIDRKTKNLCLLCWVLGARDVTGNSIATNKLIRRFINHWELEDDEETLKTALHRLEEELRAYERRT